jgi:cellulose synthase/poly-beta-1,6-N-acetylglucosamine synthase-like glycosyltransferase
LTSLAIGLAGALLGLILGQSLLVAGFVRALARFAVPLISDDRAPKAVVVLCLRGTDPFLKDCIAGLLNQDYPNYKVRIVVDSADDPAHRVLNETLKPTDYNHVTVENLTQPSSSCSLKCSSLCQVARSLDPSIEFIAQMDADIVAHHTWLRELATALEPADVGAATGNRWYMPHVLSTGSLVRYAWNAAAIVQMYWYRVAWGGTLAVKTRVLRESDMLECWGRAFCEDTMQFAQLEKLCLKVRFVPSLMMINRENTSLGGFYRWVIRQLLTVRLYHPAWSAILLHGVISTVVPLGSLALLIVAILRGNAASTLYLGGAFSLFVISILLSLWRIAVTVNRIAESRGEPTKWIHGVGDLLKCAALMPITQFVYPAALAEAAVKKSTNWRGIQYEIKGPWDIRVEEYVPYREEEQVQVGESL